MAGRFPVGGQRPDVEELTVTDEIKGKGASSGPITEILGDLTLHGGDEPSYIKYQALNRGRTYALMRPDQQSMANPAGRSSVGGQQSSDPMLPS